MNQQAGGYQGARPQRSGGGLLVGLGAIVLMLGGAGIFYVLQEADQSAKVTAQIQRQRDEGARQEAQRQAEQQAVQAAKIAAEQQKAQEVNAVATSPGAYLEWSNPEYFDKGIINDYRQLTGLTILNKAHYAVSDVQGNVTFADNQGRPFGSLPFSLRGSIPAGDTKTFTAREGTIQSGTIEGRASKVSIAFTHVRVIP